VGALAESIARDGRSRGGRRTARAAEGKDVASFLLPRGTGMSRRVSQKNGDIPEKAVLSQDRRIRFGLFRQKERCTCLCSREYHRCDADHKYCCSPNGGRSCAH
jgi:hypothetical protein